MPVCTKMMYTAWTAEVGLCQLFSQVAGGTWATFLSRPSCYERVADELVLPEVVPVLRLTRVLPTLPCHCAPFLQEKRKRFTTALGMWRLLVERGESSRVLIQSLVFA